jgi:Flp pilus assembly protein TadG
MLPSLKKSSGVSAVELALFLPILVLLVFGVIEFGILLHDKQVVTNASREGVRAAIAATTTGYKTDDIKQIVINYCTNHLINLGGSNDLAADKIAISGPDGQNDITVTVLYDYNFLFAKIIGINTTTLGSETVMRLE